MKEMEENILENSSNWKVPSSRSKDEIWNALESQIQKGDEEPNTSNRWLVWAAAVSLIILGASSVFFFSSNLQVDQTGIAEVKTVALPDGSLVVLNASSELSYDVSEFSEDRKVSFKGEGYFDIQSGDSFIINLDETEVRVLGTSFNIYSREEMKEVKCLTGKVSVSDEKGKVILSPGTMAISINGELKKEAKGFDVENAISWQHGEFVFNNTPLTRVVREMEIQFGVEIVFNNAEERYYTGFFNRSNIEKAAKQVFSPMGYSYIISEGKIVIQ